MMKALNFTLNSVTMLALVLMVGVVIDDAIVVLENIFRFIEEKKLNSKRCSARGDKRYWTGGAGYHAVSSGDFPACVFHVVHLRTLSIPVRHHRGGCDPRQLAGVVHAYADDELAAD
jgi:hypothetical protein